jgi:peptidoglycan/xylan/chitin deacetylase (PgdA/CDA1 family)
MRAVPILTYHALDDSGSVVSFPPSLFRDQVRSMHARGFVGLSLSQLLDAWDAGAALPPRSVVITFDDAYASVLERAAPVLVEARFSATVFAVAGACGGTNEWGGMDDVPRMPLLSWEELRALAGAGFDVGSHSMSHAWLPGLDDAALHREVTGAAAMIEDRLGRPVTTFAYPYGAHDERVVAAVRRRHRGAVSVVMRTARASDDRMLLPRLDAYYLRHPAFALGFGTPACSAWLLARRAGRAAREVLVRLGLVDDAAGSKSAADRRRRP